MTQYALVAAIGLLLLSSVPSAADDHVTGIDIGKDYEARVRAGIEHNRKSGAEIDVISKNGAKIPGAKVSVKQTTSDFLFGCAFPMCTEPPARLGAAGWQDWNGYFTRIFNFATTENSLKWWPLEPNEGEMHWQSADFIANWCREHNIKLKGHNLVWGTDQAGTPGWVYKYPPDKINDLFEKHIRTVMGRYKKEIRTWDVVNEPVHLHSLEKAWRPDYVMQSYKLARAADPDATLVINDFSNFVGADQWFVPLVKDLVRKGAPVDVLAEQAHDPPYWYPPRNIFDTLDRMAETGLRIHLTEFTYPSNGAKITGGFVQGNWDEQKQAEFYKYFFTLAFSHPNVDAITMWAMWDGSTWLPKGGIIREDWTPKPAYVALDDLINNKWKTRFESRSDANGQVRFHGFHGDYEVTVTTASGKTVSTTTHISRGSQGHLEVVMD